MWGKSLGTQLERLAVKEDGWNGFFILHIKMSVLKLMPYIIKLWV